MKYKYTGENNTFCLELVAFGIMGKGEYLKRGQIIDVPNDNTTVINALNASGLFQEVKVSFNKSKNSNKKVEIKKKEIKE